MTKLATLSRPFRIALNMLVLSMLIIAFVPPPSAVAGTYAVAWFSWGAECTTQAGTDC